MPRYIVSVQPETWSSRAYETYVIAPDSVTAEECARIRHVKNWGKHAAPVSCHAALAPKKSRKSK